MIITRLLARAATLALLSTLVAGCGDKPPSGQVVAVVNGDEVTRRDLAAEPGAASANQGQADLAAMLTGVIDRKLVAAEAERLGLDKTPQFVAQAKRLQEVLLSRDLFARWADEAPAPSAVAISNYIARNPQRFEGRKLFLVDRIETAESGTIKQALGPLQTNDAVAAYLTSHDQPFRRERTVLDSASLPNPLFRQLLALRQGYPLAFAQNGRLNVLAVIEARDEPLPAADRDAAAVAALKRRAVQQRLIKLRKTANIAYQPGYRPAAGASEPPGP